MLARRPLSEGEIGEKLAGRGFDAEAAAGALARLRELGLADDRALCLRLARSYRESRRYGSRKIAATLARRLFPAGVVADVMREMSSGGEELAAALAALGKKFREGIPPGREGAARAWRFLAGRGFDPEACRLAIRASSRSTIDEGE